MGIIKYFDIMKNPMVSFVSNLARFQDPLFE